jgi:hypothetical protein
MKAVRIYAVGVEDDKHKVVVISQIDESGFLNKEIESFGTITHYEMETDVLIKSIFQLTERNATGFIFYGDNSYDAITTNIYKKPLSPGEVFSLFYDHEDPETNESILVIRNITDYVKD